MKNQPILHGFQIAVLSATLLLIGNPEIDAGGLGGRGGGHSFSGGGGRSIGGGGSASFGGGRPNMNARPNLGNASANLGARPNFGGGGLPVQRPQTSMPHLGGSSTRPNISRPSISDPGINRPSPNRPGLNRPDASLPTTLPSRPDVKLPDRGSLGNRPTTLPGRVPDGGRPGGFNRPAVTPPGSSRPSMPDFGKLPGGRPSGGELGDFLGLDKPIGPSGPGRPGKPTTLPGDLGSNRPDRPGRPTTLPGDRLPIAQRPSIDIGDVNLGNNTVISNKPRWANIDNDRYHSINRRWQNQIGNATTLPALNPNRYDHFHNWGNNVRDHWYGGRYPGYFRPDWWARHQFRCSGWHYFYSYANYPYTYWWGTPTYTDVTSWFTWNAPAASWQQPAYYDYGTGGNVTYQDNSVYISGNEIASADEFAESAATLATVPAPENLETAENSQWLPLGTFALTTDPDDVDPTRIVQLAVNKEGIVSGTIYNKETDQTQAIQGRVDKETQRVALRIGESEDVIAETGLYNLTQDEASVLVHFGTETQDTYLLVRLPAPEESATEQ
ncbi:mu-protocadherin- cell-suface protein [Neorhodopirellula pilleata]|nr:mu-protocadherin- cell-suface protein [Neorhodopirellula pilleata]